MVVTYKDNCVDIKTESIHIKIGWYGNEIHVRSKAINETWVDSEGIKLSAINLSRTGREHFLLYAQEVIGVPLLENVQEYVNSWPQ